MQSLQVWELPTFGESQCQMVKNLSKSKRLRKRQILGQAEGEDLTNIWRGTDQKSRRKTGRFSCSQNQRAFGDKEVCSSRYSQVIQVIAGQQHLWEPGGFSESHLKGKVRTEARVH